MVILAANCPNRPVSAHANIRKKLNVKAYKAPSERVGTMSAGLEMMPLWVYSRHDTP
jgi:hypothetical protein